MATGTNISPRNKHIAFKYHHFRYGVKYVRVDIHYRPIGENFSDLLTNPLSNKAFFTLFYMICGWNYTK